MWTVVVEGYGSSLSDILCVCVCFIPESPGWRWEKHDLHKSRYGCKDDMEPGISNYKENIFHLYYFFVFSSSYSSNTKSLEVPASFSWSFNKQHVMQALRTTSEFVCFFARVGPYEILTVTRFPSIFFFFCQLLCFPFSFFFILRFMIETHFVIRKSVYSCGEINLFNNLISKYPNLMNLK